MGVITCPKCRTETPVSQVRYLSADEYVCASCASRQESASQVPSSASFDASPGAHKTLICQNCGFANSVRKSSSSSACGYCGSSSLAEDSSSAASLLAQADDVDTSE